jgi:hypothetical protein
MRVFYIISITRPPFIWGGGILKKIFGKFYGNSYLCLMVEEMDEFFQESEIQRLEGEIFELESQLKEHRDKERIYQEILSEIRHSLKDLFKREEENNRFRLGEEIDYRSCLVGLGKTLDELIRVYRGKINF